MSTLAPALSTSYAPAVMLGSTVPRLWTPPLRELTPATSVGFDQIDFARNVLRRPFDPWQEWLVIHAGELLADGSPRFSLVLVLVARQNGKTEVLVILSLYWLYVDRVPLVLGTSTKVDYAKESWKKAVQLARRTPILAAEIPVTGGVRVANGEQELMVRSDDDLEHRYKIAASNAEGGRSLSIDRLILDELRQHRDYSAWDSLEPATSARPGSQIWALSNAGDDRSVVLNDKRAEALAAIEAGEDTDVMLAEWSSPEGADPEDLAALAQANPNLGLRKDARKLLANARRAKASGGEALTGFKTESMCMRVPKVNPAVDPSAWQRCLDVGDLADARSRIALCLDLAPDGLHATLAAAAVLEDGRVRIEPVQAWEGAGCAAQLRAALPRIATRIKPQVVGWLPAGPAAALAADMRKRPGWPPAGVTVAEIRAEAPAVCMGFAEHVEAMQLAHSDDPLFNAHVLGSEPLYRGDVWVFSRKGGHCDGAYAAAGAVHLARTLPAPVGRPRLVVLEE